MRKCFPTNWGAMTMTKYEPKDGETGMEYVQRAVDKWETTTGTLPTAGTGGPILRHLVVAGLPQVVKDKLEEDPMLYQKGWSEFQVITAHAYDRHRKNEKAEQ